MRTNTEDKTEKLCEWCGRGFWSRNKKQKFCGRRCYGAYLKMGDKARQHETLCWQCGRTNGNECVWFSEAALPVEGWTALRRDTPDGDSYFVISCPNFQPYERLKTLFAGRKQN